MASARSSALVGSTVSPASPTVSASPVVLLAITGVPRRHGLERRQPEALVERREDERARRAVERGQLVVLHVTDEVHAARQPRAQDRVEHVEAAASVAARDHELAVGPAPDQARIRLDRERHVLARLQRADAQQVRPVDAEALADMRLGLRQRPEARADAVRDGDHLGRDRGRRGR